MTDHYHHQHDRPNTGNTTNNNNNNNIHGRNPSLNFSRPLHSNSSSMSSSVLNHTPHHQNHQNQNPNQSHQKNQKSISNPNSNSNSNHIRNDSRPLQLYPQIQSNQQQQQNDKVNAVGTASSSSIQNQNQNSVRNGQNRGREEKGGEMGGEVGGGGGGEETSTSQFSSFWKRSVRDKFGGGSGGSGGKGGEIVFLKPDGVGDFENPGKSKERPTAEMKKSRREQVRRAQIEHRNRKKNYVAYLESDILELREKIDAINLESNSIRTENDHMKSALERTAQVATLQSLRILPTSKFSTAAAVVRRQEVERGELARSLEGLSGELRSQGGNGVGGVTKIMMGFDEMLGANCLRTSYASSSTSNSSSSDSAPENVVVGRQGRVEIAVDTPTLFSFPGNSFGGSRGEAMDYNIHGHGQNNSSQYNNGHSNTNEVKLDPETVAEIGINFILALEHPCLTHFHHTPHPHPAPNPKSESTGHVLMASSAIYSHAPAHIFPNIAQQSKTKYPVPSAPTFTQNKSEPLYIPADDCTWQIGGGGIGTANPPPSPPSTPIQELLKLKALNDSLPKDEVEITPVQAWFLMVEFVGVGGLVGVNDVEGAAYSDGYGGADAKATGRGGVDFEKLEVLKRELGKLVRCVQFGAVVEGWRFWEVLRGVVGGEPY